MVDSTPAEIRSREYASIGGPDHQYTELFLLLISAGRYKKGCWRRLKYCNGYQTLRADDGDGLDVNTCRPSEVIRDRVGTGNIHVLQAAEVGNGA